MIYTVLPKFNNRKIKIKLTDAVSVDTGYSSSKLYAVKMGADPVQVDVVISD